MEYSVGSLADLISGSRTPNKPRVVQEKVKIKRKVGKYVVPIPLAKKARQSGLNYSPRNGSDSNNDSEKDSVEITPSTQAIKKKIKRKEKKHAIHYIEPGNMPVTLQDNEISSSTGDTNSDSALNTTKINSNNERHLANIAKKENKADIDLYKERTLFVGNVPVSANKLQLKKLFRKFGTVEAVRFRSVPVVDPRTPKKVAAIKKQFHPDRNAMHSYIRFATREEALKALALNGHTYQDLHLRVNICDSSSKPDDKKAIFVGNIPFDAEEEDVWKLFEPCGEIESVRLVRDSRTSIGKGFGYVNFKSSDAVELTLQVEGLKLKDRELRVAPCNALKKSKKSKKVAKNQGKYNKKLSETNRKKSFKTQNSEGSLISAALEDKDDHTNKLKIVNFQGRKFTDTKKKKKCDKGALHKKNLISQIAPRTK